MNHRMYLHVLGMKLLAYFVAFSTAIIGASLFMDLLIYLVVIKHWRATTVAGILACFLTYLVIKLLILALTLDPKKLGG